MFLGSADEAKPSFDEAKLNNHKFALSLVSLRDVDGFDETRA